MSIAPTEKTTTRAPLTPIRGSLREPYGSYAAGTPTLAVLADANDWINSAYTAIADFRERPSARAADSARDSLAAAGRGLAFLADRTAPDETSHAARLVLPRIDRAQEILSRMGQAVDDRHLRPLLSEFDAAMDHIEEVLAAAGWD